MRFIDADKITEEEIAKYLGIKYASCSEDIMEMIKEQPTVIAGGGNGTLRSQKEKAVIDKCKVTDIDIIVEMLGERPYYSLKYKKLGQDFHYIGYSSFCLDTVIKWKNEEFEKVEEDIEDEWIKCTDCMPEQFTDVLVTVKYSGFMGMYGTWEKVGHLTDYGWDGDCIDGEVVAWMPLPEPYKGVQ